MLRAERTHAFEISVRRHEHAVRSADSLEEERGDGVRTFELDDLFEHRQRLGRRVPSARHPVVRVEDVHHARQTRLGAPPPRIARQRDRPVSTAVVGAVARGTLASGVCARQLDRVLVGVRAAVGEEEHVDVAWRERCELRPQPPADLRRHERVRVGHRRRLLLNGGNDALVAVSGVDAHQLTVEVEIALAVKGPEVHALGAGHGDGNRRLPALTIRTACACGRGR